MKKLIFLLFYFPIFIACEDVPVLTSSLKSFNETDLEDCRDTACPKITLDYPVYAGDETIVSNINNRIGHFLMSNLYIGDGGIPAHLNWKEAARQFVRANKDLKTEFDMELNYEAKVSISESFRNNQVLTLETQNYLFTGGAHGYGGVHFNHFDLETGEELPTEALFNDVGVFQTMAEIQFRKANGLPEEGSINATGFWFEDDQFKLPETLGLSKEGIVLIYNAYDIASYADGSIELILDWETVLPYLSNLYFP